MPPPPLEDLQWIDKGTAPFLGWSINAAGPFPKDADGNRFLLIAVDPFPKWVEACPVPSLHSWWAAEFLEDIMHRWGKLRYVQTDHGLEFKGSFARAYARCSASCTRSQQLATARAMGRWNASSAQSRMRFTEA